MEISGVATNFLIFCNIYSGRRASAIIRGCVTVSYDGRSVTEWQSVSWWKGAGPWTLCRVRHAMWRGSQIYSDTVCGPWGFQKSIWEPPGSIQYHYVFSFPVTWHALSYLRLKHGVRDKPLKSVLISIAQNGFVPNKTPREIREC